MCVCVLVFVFVFVGAGGCGYVGGWVWAWACVGVGGCKSPSRGCAGSYCRFELCFAASQCDTAPNPLDENQTMQAGDRGACHSVRKRSVGFASSLGLSGFVGNFSASDLF